MTRSGICNVCEQTQGRTWLPGPISFSGEPLDHRVHSVDMDIHARTVATCRMRLSFFRLGIHDLSSTLVDSRRDEAPLFLLGSRIQTGGWLGIQCYDALNFALSVMSVTLDTFRSRIKG